MKNIYILEGADGTGKTSLSKLLSSSLKLPYFHFGAPDPSLQDNYGNLYQYISVLDNLKTSAVWDRGLISHLFYEKLRRNNEPNYRGVSDMLTNSHNFRFIFILCLRDWDDSIYQSNKDHYTSLEQAKKEFSLFKYFTVKYLSSYEHYYEATLNHYRELKKLIRAYEFISSMGKLSINPTIPDFEPDLRA